MKIDNHFIQPPPPPPLTTTVKVFVTVYSSQCLLCTGVVYNTEDELKGALTSCKCRFQLDVSWLSVSVRLLSRNKHVWSKVCCCEPTRSGLVCPRSGIVVGTCDCTAQSCGYCIVFIYYCG